MFAVGACLCLSPFGFGDFLKQADLGLQRVRLFAGKTFFISSSPMPALLASIISVCFLAKSSMSCWWRTLRNVVSGIERWAAKNRPLSDNATTHFQHTKVASDNTQHRKSRKHDQTCKRLKPQTQKATRNTNRKKSQLIPTARRNKKICRHNLQTLDSEEAGNRAQTERPNNK